MVIKTLLSFSKTRIKEIDEGGLKEILEGISDMLYAFIIKFYCFHYFFYGLNG